MNKWKILGIVASSTVGAIALSLIILTIISHKVYRRSLMATLVVFFFRLTVHHKRDSQVIEDVKYLPLKNDVSYKVPARARTAKQKSQVFKGMTVISVNMQPTFDRVVVYLHGGGYVRQPRLYHWHYLNKLGAKVGNLVVPIYPKAPNHNPDEVFQLMTEFYQELLNRYSTVILMGDSSGGGLALSLCQQWGEMGLKQPSKTILFSPWVDLTLSNPEIEEYQRIDPLISAASERIWAKVWAHDASLTDWRISPLYGPMDKLGDVVLYSGNREILYPDLCKLQETMSKAGVNVKYIVGEGMNHVYQVYPIPEARKTLAEVQKEIENVEVKVNNNVNLAIDKVTV